MTNDLSYILFSPFHKWYSSFDLDEVAVTEKDFSKSSSGIIEPQSAQILYDRLNNMKGENISSVLQLGWLEYDVERVGNVKSTLFAAGNRNRTRELLRTGGLDLQPLQDNAIHNFDRSTCWQHTKVPRISPGKSAVTCLYQGFGTTVHDSVVLTNATDLNSRICTTPYQFDKDVALYHGSTVDHGIRYGNCAWRYKEN